MKRWPARIVVFLILGAVVNVAIAWACVQWSPRQTSSNMGESWDGRDSWWTAHAPDGYPAQPNFLTLQEGVGYELAAPLYGDYGRTNRKWFAEVAKAGWPCLSLYGESWGTTFARYEHRRWVLRNPFGAADQERTLPLQPIWPGLAINTVFYAGVLWLLFAGPFVLRRRRRIRRGLCPKCAYDLRGTPVGVTACPECGNVVSDR